MRAQYMLIRVVSSCIFWNCIFSPFCICLFILFIFLIFLNYGSLCLYFHFYWSNPLYFSLCFLCLELYVFLLENILLITFGFIFSQVFLVFDSWCIVELLLCWNFISWWMTVFWFSLISRNVQSFCTVNEQTFSKELLLKYFKHNNILSFIQQLNVYKYDCFISASIVRIGISQKS